MRKWFLLIGLGMLIGVSGYSVRPDPSDVSGGWGHGEGRSIPPADSFPLPEGQYQQFLRKNDQGIV